MVGHQAKSKNFYVKNVLQFPEIIQVTRKIVSVGKNHLPVMAALDDMMWVTWQNDTSNAGHD